MIKEINANVSKIIDTAIIEMARRRRLSPDAMRWEGIIRIRELPDCMDYEMYKKWWCPERDAQGKLIRQARMSEREKARYQVEEAHNLITTLGRNQILTFAGSNTTTTSFAQYFSVGTFPLNIVSPGDTNVGGELYRGVPSAYTVTGNTVDISTFFGTGVGNGVLTNAGIYGGGSATSTLGTGQLFTHALLNSYNKLNTQTVTFDYIIVLQ